MKETLIWILFGIVAFVSLCLYGYKMYQDVQINSLELEILEEKSPTIVYDTITVYDTLTRYSVGFDSIFHKAYRKGYSDGFDTMKQTSVQLLEKLKKDVTLVLDKTSINKQVRSIGYGLGATAFFCFMISLFCTVVLAVAEAMPKNTEVIFKNTQIFFFAIGIGLLIFAAITLAP